MSHLPRRWITALDLDFTAQANQTLGTNTTFTIGGLTWTKTNSAGDATAMQITNGTGLVITPASATNISAGTFTAPTLQIPFTSLINGFNPFMPLRLWLYESSSNETANSDQVVFGAYLYNPSYVNQYTVCFFRGFAGGTNGWGGKLIAIQTNVTATTTSVPFSSSRVGVGLVTANSFYGNGLLLVGSTVSGGQWPAESSLGIVASPGLSATSSTNLANSSSGANPIGNFNFFISAMRNASATSLVTTIARVRVDYLPLDN